MPVTATSEVSDHILWNAWADDTDKGSPGAGAGTELDPYDTLDAGLASLTGITKTDLNITNLYPGDLTRSAWTIEFVNTLALTDVSDFTLNIAPSTQDTNVPHPPLIDHSIIRQGSPGQNEIHEIEFLQLFIPAGRWFRVRRLSITGQRIEERIAQRWVAAVIAADPTMDILANGRVYTGRIPSNIKLGMPRPPLCILIEHQSNADILVIGGVRHFAGHLISVSAMAPQDVISDRTDLAAQRLSELFQDEQNITLNDGTMLRCVRVGQVDAPDADSTDQQWQKLGVLLDISIQQA